MGMVLQDLKKKAKQVNDIPGQQNRDEALSFTKKEFDNAYEMLCEKIYSQGGYSYKEIQGGKGESEEILDDLIDVKSKVDSKMKYFIRTIYKELKIKYYR